MNTVSTSPTLCGISALAAAGLAMLLAGPARAQPTGPGQIVDERRPASASGAVEIVNPAGATQVIGWDRAEVAVSGRLGRGATGLRFTGENGRTVVEVLTTGHRLGVASTLEIRLPRGSRVRMKSFRARIQVDDLTGSVNAESFEGSISVRRGPAEVTLKSTSGSLEVQAASRRTDLETVNGSIQVRDASGQLSAATVNGAVHVSGRRFDRVKLSTISGSVLFQGTVAPAGELHASSVNGPVQVWLPADTSGAFQLGTTNGRLISAFGARDDQSRGQRQLSFTVGSPDRQIQARSVNGSVTISKAAATSSATTVESENRRSP